MRGAFPLVLAGLLAGCGPAVTAPSLELRPAEAEAVPLPVAAGEPDGTAPEGLAPLLAGHVRAAEAGDRRFAALAADTARLVDEARAAPAGSEPWTAAQVALSALDVARRPVAAEADALDAVRHDPANAAPAARQLVEAAAGRVEALAGAEADTFARLSARLPAPPAAG